MARTKKNSKRQRRKRKLCRPVCAERSSDAGTEPQTDRLHVRGSMVFHLYVQVWIGWTEGAGTMVRHKRE